MAININEVEFEDLKTLCKRLLNFCNKLSKKPHYITNTIRIVLDHSNIINKLNLFDDKREVDEYMLPVRRKCTKPRRERPEKQMYYNAVVKMTMEWLQTHDTVTASNINKEYTKEEYQEET